MKLTPKYIVDKWKSEYSKITALAVFNEAQLSSELIEELELFYEIISEDWLEYSWEDEENLEEFSKQNQIKIYWEEFSGNLLSALKRNHCEVFSLVYAKNLYIGEDISRSMDEGYQASAEKAYEEAKGECRALGKSKLYTEKYAEEIAKGVGEDRAKKSASIFDKAFMDCREKGYSEIYSQIYAEQRSHYMRYDPDHAHTYAYCYETRLNLSDSESDARNYAETFIDQSDDWSDYNFLIAALFTEFKLSDGKGSIDDREFRKYLNEFSIKHELEQEDDIRSLAEAVIRKEINPIS